VQHVAHVSVPDPIANVCVAGLRCWLYLGRPATASAPHAAPQGQAHPLMALDQSLYRRTNFLTEEHFELYTAREKHPHVQCARAAVIAFCEQLAAVGIGSRLHSISNSL
jgi:hypothetical protein